MPEYAKLRHGALRLGRRDLELRNAWSLRAEIGLNRETQSYVCCPVKHLEKMATGQAAELTFGPLFGLHFNSSIASFALRTGDVGFPHVRKLRGKVDSL
jgi:hypothetical protein